MVRSWYFDGCNAEFCADRLRIDGARFSNRKPCWLILKRKLLGRFSFRLDNLHLVSYYLRLVDAYLPAGLDALGERRGMAIFQRLANGPMAVNELAALLPVSRPAVSQHLRVLKDAGLVVDSAEG